MEQHSNGSNNLITLSSHGKDKNLTHSRHISLESSSFRNLGPTNSILNLSNEQCPSIPTSPGVPTVINSEEFNSFSKLCSVSRGSSPSSRKKTSSDSSDRGGTLNTSHRRSPLVARKATIGSETSFSTPPTGRSRYSSNQDEDSSTVADDRDLEGRASSVVSNGSGEQGQDGTSNRQVLDTEEIDGGGILSPNNFQKTKDVLEQLETKVQKTADLIKDEQRARDENVNEYLKLSTNADRQQLQRIKAVFEKKNQKSAACILQLQKKLENYQKKKKDVETYGILQSHRQPKEVLRDVGHGLKSVGGNIRDGISGFSGRAAFIGKPKEIAHLIKNKFGSADNIKEMGEEDKDEEKNHHGSATLPPNSGLHPTSSASILTGNPQVSSGTVGSSGGGGSAGGGAGSGGGGGSSAGGKIGSDEGSECNSSITSESIPGGHVNPLAYASPKNNNGMNSFEVPLNPYMENIIQDLQERQDENVRLRDEIEMIKQTLSAEVSHLKDCLVDERFRCERLEEQVNDLTELHQSEMENLKTNITEMEEKVQYQSEERIRDLHEIFEDCLNRVQRMEHQQAQQQQQFLTLEGLENSNARMLFVKVINILLTVLQVLLLVIATLAGILTPLLQTKTRLVSTATVCLFLIFVYLQLSEIRDSWHTLITRITHHLS